MKTTNQKRSTGFTLLELLIVISIIAILAAIAFPATSLVMTQARKAQAKQQAGNIVNAIKLYETQYSVLPIGDSGGEELLETDSSFIDILTGEDVDQNPKETAFIEGKEAKAASGRKPARGGFVSEGNGSSALVDPWGNYFAVIMDADDDGQIKVPMSENELRTKAVAWSYGKPPSSADYKSAKGNEDDQWQTTWK